MSDPSEPASPPPAPGPAAPPAPPALSEAQTFWLAAAFLLLVLGYMTVAGCVRAPFSSYDDRIHIAWNPLLQEGHSSVELFTRPHYQQYIPVTLFSFKLNYALFGRDALASFRVFNWLLHAASGLLLLALLMRLGLSRLEALFLAAVWTAHPLACESVGWVSQRSNCLAACFGFAGLLAYAEWHRNWRGLVLGALGFLLALLSKPAALGFLPVFVALELLGGPAGLRKEPGARDEPGAGRWLGAALRLAPLAVLAAVFAVIGVERAAIALMPPPGGHWYTALLTDLEILPRYLFNIFLPVKLSAFYAVPDVQSLADGRIYLFGPVLAALVGASLWVARSRRRALFGWLWFLGALGPVLNLLAISFVMQDRYVYFASVGALLVGLEVLAGLAARVQPAGKEELGLNRPVVYAAGACVVLLAFTAAARSVLWDGRYLPLLFADAVEKQPESGLARVYYGMTQATAAEHIRTLETARSPQAFLKASEEAIAQLKAGQSKPDFYRYFNPLLVQVTLAELAIQQHRRDDAREALAQGFPPPPPPAGPEAGLSRKELEFGFRAGGTGPYGMTYLYKIRDLAVGHVLLAKADLQEFADPATPADRALKLVESARERLALALAVDPACREIYFTQAMLELVTPAPADRAEPGPWLKHAKDRLAEGAPALETTLNTEEMRSVFRPPVPAGRPAALAQLALSQAALSKAELLRRQQDTPREGLATAQKALEYAEAALQLDPTFLEACWAQARVHLQMDEFCERAKDLNGSWEHFKKAQKLLASVPATSPYYFLSQAMLKTSRPPPPPPAPKPGETKAENPPAPGKADAPAKREGPPPKAEGEARKAEDRGP